ncbi:phage terminase large subunit [Reyranella sp.]|uniref:phage terminase large subunit n=1 Tax=Reyranella sp. TaxID=1929291 RepID=UPI00273200EB|nr:phage terminase large subunit [Reyranella sp.]MDP2374268.1 phage terminase large subunit [Reyranella sp.]
MTEPTAYQHTALSVPEKWNLLLCGGRGGGKTTAMALVILRHCEKYKGSARPLVVRETHKALTDIEDKLHALFFAAYGAAVSHSRTEHIFRLPNGAQVECGQIDGPRAYTKYQGRETTLLCVDEYGLFRDRRWVDMLKSNLRAAEGVPLRVVASANPGGPLHAHIHRNYVAAAPAWHPFELEGEMWVCAPSTLRDNPHLDHTDYERRLRASCGRDEALARAWIDGDWNIARGAYFAGDIDERVHMLPVAWPHIVTRKHWLPFIAMDWGSSAPSVTYVCLRAPGDIGPFPKGSLILLDELATADRRDPNVGLGWPPDKLAEAVKEMCGRWNISPSGVGDDAVGLGDTLLQSLSNSGIYLTRPRKERISGWQAMRQRLVATKEGNGQPGMWITARCRYFWETVPYIQRDDARPEDIDTMGPDHAADAARYAVMHCNEPGWRSSRHTVY